MNNKEDIRIYLGSQLKRYYMLKSANWEKYNIQDFQKRSNEMRKVREDMKQWSHYIEVIQSMLDELDTLS